MSVNNIQQHSNHTAKERTYQVVMPLDLGINIPLEDSVRTLIRVTERMDYSSLTRAYRRNVEADEATPKQLFQLVMLGFMNNKYSTREISKACTYDIRFMWLLGDRNPPSHTRIARFIKERLLGDVIEDLFYQMVKLLKKEEEITGENVFVDGTKTEANANRYTFVWGKAVHKNAEKLKAKQARQITEAQNDFPFALAGCGEIGEVLRRLKELWDTSGQTETHGKGKHKSKLQRHLEGLSETVEKQRQYDTHQKILGTRNSYSKTDHDATFMRMKEDHMRNGQLKPAYNIQMAIEGEYIVGLDVTSDRNDANALLPLLEKIEKKSGIKHQNIVADAGYESEENYVGLEKRGQNAYIKPQNYEKSKKRSFGKNRYLRENMPYDEQNDCYQCPNGEKLTFRGNAKRKSKSGYEQTVSVYEADDCSHCPFKEDCTRAKGVRKLSVSKTFEQLRAASRERITSEMGILLRINRSIQSEGTFGVLKEDWKFRLTAFQRRTVKAPLVCSE